MPLQNRVDPFGTRHAVPERGHWFGNRGLLHNDRGEFVREWKVKRWIICELEFKGRSRKLLQPGQYTELFFMDEATALAAGHRPCMECRRDAAKLFLELAGFRKVGDFDEQLHLERYAQKPFVDSDALPNGAMVELDGKPWLLNHGELLRWTHSGYKASIPLPQERVKLLTPATTVEVIKKGYLPQISIVDAH